jgi:type II secretory pathway component PulF
LIAIALFLAVLRRLAKMETGRMFMDGAILHTPLIGRFVRDVEMGRFARTFGLLVEAGIPIERVLQLSANTMGNAVLQREVERVRSRTVEQGMPLSGGLHASDWFPGFFANMVAVGEETGRLEESLEDVARYYDSSVKRQGRITAALIEPLLLLVVGSVVGFIVFAMLMPIFELGGRLQ